MIPKSGYRFRKRSCSTNRLERDDESKKSHHALDVESQDVVLGQTESADWCSIFDAGVWPVPIVAMQPGRQLVFSLARVFIGLGVGPFAQAGLDESLDLAIGLGCVGLGADVPQGEALAGGSEGKGFIAGAIVSHDALDLDPEACVISERCLEKGDGAALLLVGHDLGKGDAGVIVDANVDILPADATAAALASAVAGNAVADVIELAELFDVDVDQLAGMLAFVASDRLDRFKGTQPIETQPTEDAAHSGRRDRELGGDLLAAVALSAQSLDGSTCGLRSLVGR